MDKIFPLNMYRVEELIQELDENTLLSLVMRLTAGHANPDMAYKKIREYKNQPPDPNNH